MSSHFSKSTLRSVLASHHNKSGFRGVFWDNRKQRFRAQIGGRVRKRKNLGRYKTAEEAAAAYDAEAIEWYGEDAALNFPLRGERKTIFKGLCKHCGHGLDDIYISPSGRKNCRICNKEAAARYKIKMINDGYRRKKHGPWIKADSEVAAE